MKKISIDQIVSVSRKQPFTARSLEFLQNYNAEDLAGVIKTIITQNLGSYSLTVPYVISGCVVSDSGKDVTAGEVFYGGKYYETTAVNGVTNIAQFILTKTQDATADPLEFTNGDMLNVHDIYKFVATDTATAGTFDSSDLVSAYGAGKISSQLILTSQSTYSATYVDMTDGVNPDLSYTTPNDGVTRKFKFTLKGDAELGAASGTTAGFGGKFQIYNSTDATSLDISRIETSVIFPSGSGDVVGCIPINCCTIVTLAPNKLIKCRMLNDADGVTVKECKFLIEEV